MGQATDIRQFLKQEDITPDSLNQRFRRLFRAVNRLEVVSKTAAYTVGVGDDVILGSAGSAFTVSLPTASGIRGRVYTIKKTDSSANAVTIDGAGSETIDGALTVALSTQYAFRIIVSDGTNWHVISS